MLLYHSHCHLLSLTKGVMVLFLISLSVGWNSPVSDPNASPSKKISKQVTPTSGSVKPYESAVTGTTLKCIDEPSFSFDTGNEYNPAEPVHSTTKGSEGSEEQHNVLENPDMASSISQTGGKSLATDVFEKARSRFDNFWGKGKDESNEKEGKV